MAAKEKKTVGTNPLKLPWPSDRQGITQKLQREGCRAIGRMGGDEANLEMVMEVLRILAAHAAEKLADQKVAAEATLVKTVAARDKVAAVARESLDRRAAALRSERAGIDAKLKTIEAA